MQLPLFILIRFDFWSTGTRNFKQPLNSRHPATLYNGQFSGSQYTILRGHSSTFSETLSTIAAEVNNLTLDWCCYLNRSTRIYINLCRQRTARENVVMLCSMA